ncbi:MAG: aldo/keto reductase [Alphaproteobacteria bacterium]
MPDIKLGLGLVSIGRTWGVLDVPPPSPEDAMALLATAVEQDIRLFDTAPAYAASEKLLGVFLASLGSEREQLTIATKMGEFWDESRAGTYVDHTYDRLVESIEASLKLLGRVDLLQVHKAKPENIVGDGVLKAIEFAKGCGVGSIGASVSDVATAKLACESGCYQYVQMPFNRDYTVLEAVFETARKHDMGVLVNRPLAMGKLAQEQDKGQAIAAAYRFILGQDFSGWMLMGTSSKHHLVENIAAFQVACG